MDSFFKYSLTAILLVSGGKNPVSVAFFLEKTPEIRLPIEILRSCDFLVCALGNLKLLRSFFPLSNII